MKACMGFGLEVHDRFLLPFMLEHYFFVWCDVGNIIIRLSNRSSVGRSGRPSLLPRPIVFDEPFTVLVIVH